jgi:hypothetical protein
MRRNPFSELSELGIALPFLWIKVAAAAVWIVLP